MQKKIIYDFGANSGQNLKYFLSKSDLVIAVEPIFELCEKIKKNFNKEIKKGKLIVENLAVVDDDSISSVDFYQNNKSWLSTLKKDDSLDFKKIKVDSTTPTALFDKYGYPYYIKIDIENFDINILRFLKEKNIEPKFISFEAQNEETYNYFRNNFSYQFFNFVLGSRVHKDYGSRFEFHSSGPIFGDFKYNWVNERFLTLCLKIHKYGWIDVHCTNERVQHVNCLEKIKILLYFASDRFNKIILRNTNKLKGKFKEMLFKRRFN